MADFLMNLSDSMSYLLAEGPGLETSWIIFIIIAGVMGLVLLILTLNFGALWLKAYLSGARVSLINLVEMRLRQVNPSVIVNALIMATKAGLALDVNKLEAHYLARGNVTNVVRALIAASKADIPLNFERAAAIDLTGHDVLEAVRTSVNPKVIDLRRKSDG